MNAIDYLLKEHRRIKKLFTTLSNSSSRVTTRQKLYASLSEDLKHHEKMEESIWYRYLTKNTDLAPVIDLLVTEEKSAMEEMKKIKKLKDQEAWDKSILALQSAVLKHVEDEETKLFPKAKKMVADKELLALGKKMRAFKKQLDD